MIQPRKYECVVRGKRMFRVWMGKSLTGGKVRQKYFYKEPEADQFIQQVVDAHQREGQQAFLLNFEQRFEAVKCLQRLEPFGISLMDAVEHYITQHGAKISGKTVAHVTEEFLKSCRRGNLKPRSIVQYESDLSVFGEAFGDSQLVAITREDLEEWLDESDWAARTKCNKLTTLTTYYTFAIEKGFCNLNPVTNIKRPKVDDEPIGVLTPEQTQALLNQAAKDHKKMVGGLAIAIFAGLRRSEVCGLDWDEVHLQEREIEVLASKAKTRQRRVVQINETLAKWLAVYARKKGRVVVTDNLDVWGKWVKEVSLAAGIKVWPKNALRHGFGSYYFALIKDENRVAAEMGNSPAMVHRHYRAMIGNADCVKFWAISPPEKASAPTTIPAKTPHENFAAN